MTSRIFIIAIIFLMIGCKTKQQTGQSNLNETIGWESVKPDDYTILLIRWRHTTVDSTEIIQKIKLDEAVLKELRTNSLGDQAENDKPSETDLNFIVAKDYKKALAVMLTVAESFGLEQKLAVYERHYNTFDKWEDKIIYPN